MQLSCIITQYGVAMTLVFILQIAAAITGFSLISQSRDMVSGQLDTMMRYYNYNYRQEVDWIQSKVSFAENIFTPKNYLK